jgi:hypothetical protein
MNILLIVIRIIALGAILLGSVQAFLSFFEICYLKSIHRNATIKKIYIMLHGIFALLLVIIGLIILLLWK